MNYGTIVHLVHMLLSGPLLIYVALAQPHNKYVYWLLMALGVAICAKFAYTAFTTELSQRHVWYAIHAVLFAALLGYVGYKGSAESGGVPRVGYSLLLAVGIAAVGYHTVRLIQENMAE